MGMQAQTLGRNTDTSEAMGLRLLRQHKELFPTFWEWSDNQVDLALMGRPLYSVFGWRILGVGERGTTYRNFKLQAGGADMLRLSVAAMVERGIGVAAMVHDAVLIEADLEDLDSQIEEARRCMQAASRAVLGGVELKIDAEVVRYPDRYRDKRGAEMWERITTLLEEISGFQNETLRVSK